MWKGSQDTPNKKKGFDIKVWHILKTRTVGLAVELCPDCVQHLECWKLPARSTGLIGWLWKIPYWLEVPWLGVRGGG